MATMSYYFGKVGEQPPKNGKCPYKDRPVYKIDEDTIKDDGLRFAEHIRQNCHNNGMSDEEFAKLFEAMVLGVTNFFRENHDKSSVSIDSEDWGDVQITFVVQE